MAKTGVTSGTKARDMRIKTAKEFIVRHCSLTNHRAYVRLVDWSETEVIDLVGYCKRIGVFCVRGKINGITVLEISASKEKA